MVKVPLKGLNIRCARGKWYVSPRSGGPSFITGFVGTKDDLIAHLATPEAMDAYQAKRKRASKASYGPGTLGALVDAYATDLNPRWAKLKPASRKDYDKVIAWLRPEFATALEHIDEAQVYEVRDKAAVAKWPRFADTMVSLLSAMFKFAVQRRLMRSNPAKGIERVQINDPNANREWSPEEFRAVTAAAPEHIKTPMMIARYLGYRGQTIAPLVWSQYTDSPEYGRIMTVTARKNDEAYWLPVAPELIAYLGSLKRTSTMICTTTAGKPWKNEQAMQGAVSRFLRRLEKDGAVAPGLTLHGLRVTFAAALKRDKNASDKDIATALGDRSERMGGHYARHVERQASIIRLFKKEG